MSININEIYTTISQQANTDENGQLKTSFNAFLKMAELALMDWLTGKLDVNGNPFPAPSKFLTQKNKDWLRKFIVKEDLNFTAGIIEVPNDYYTFESMRVAWLNTDCDESGKPINWNDVILLNSDKVANRLQSAIEGIKPTSQEPIAEIIGNEFVLHPEEMDGQAKLIYIRYPVYGVYGTTVDPIYNDDVYNEATSKNLEWEEALIPYFVDKMMMYISTRNGATDQFQMTQASKP